MGTLEEEKKNRRISGIRRMSNFRENSNSGFESVLNFNFLRRFVGLF
jgi:hypothetical protein